MDENRLRKLAGLERLDEFGRSASTGKVALLGGVEGIKEGLEVSISNELLVRAKQGKPLPSKSELKKLTDDYFQEVQEALKKVIQAHAKKVTAAKAIEKEDETLRKENEKVLGMIRGGKF
jgi:hypothetical protein